MQSSVDYGKAFTFPQEDPDWIKKVAIAGAVTLIPVAGGFLLWGYMLEIVRRVIAGEAPVLPEWSDFGGLLKKGLYYFVVGFVYGLPLILLLACIGLPYLGVAFAGNDEDLAGILATISTVVSACFGCLALIYALVIAVVMPAAIGKLAVSGEIAPALRFGEVFALVRAKPAVYVIVALVAALAVSILTSVGSIACGIGAIFGAAYGAIAAGHLYGQAYRTASAETSGAAPAPSM
jgi:hypothetical protein